MAVRMTADTDTQLEALRAKLSEPDREQDRAAHRAVQDWLDAIEAACRPRNERRHS